MNTVSINCDCQIGSFDVTFGQPLQDLQCFICGRVFSPLQLYEKFKQLFLSENPSSISRMTSRKKIPEELKTIIDGKYLQFADKSRLSELDSFDWAWIIVETPQAIQWSNVSDFSDPIWNSLLENVPDKDKGKLETLHDFLQGKNLKKHLSVLNEFEKYVCWSRIPTEDWLYILQNAPQYAEHCDMTKFSPSEWVTILRTCPHFAVNCPWTTFDFPQWVEVFRSDLDYSKYCKWEKFTSAQWVELLKEFPQLSKKCSWRALAPADWLKLFDLDPVYSDKCPDWTIFAGADLNALLAAHPELVSHCPAEMLLSAAQRHTNPASIPPEKVEILFNHCSFKNDFRFIRTSPTEQSGRSASPSLFASENIFFAFVNFFCLGKYVDWEKFTPFALLPIFKKYPSILTSYPFAGNKLGGFDWNSYSNSDWQHITAKITLPPVLRPVYELRTGKKIAENLKLHPELETFCNWDTMSSAEWTALLIAIPSGCWKSCKWGIIEESDWNKIIKDGRNTYAISAYEVSRGKNLAANLKKYPDLKNNLDLTTASASEWLDLLAECPEQAANCPWEKILRYINRLPAEQRESAETRFPGMWAKRKVILFHVNIAELEKLPPDKYYTLLDFFDWEDFFDESSLDGIKKMSSAERVELFSKHPQFGKKYGWDKLSSAEKVQLAILSEAFCRSYGWDKFTEEETLKILERHREYLDKFNPVRFTRSFWMKLIDLDETFGLYYKLNLFDYLLFRKFNSTKLCGKITFCWHFIFCLAAFAGFGYFMYDGPCGYQALWQESHLNAVYAASIYGGIAILWSCFHAWLYSGRTPFILTIISGMLGGLLAAMQFGYTFFLSKITVSNYICWGILAFTAFILMIAKTSRGELFTSNRSGLKAMSFLYVPLLIATVAVSHPIVHSQFLQVYEQIEKSPRPFHSAANYYLYKTFRTDAATREIIKDLKTKLGSGDYDGIEALYAQIPPRYSALPEVTSLADQVKSVLLQQKEKYTNAAIKAYRQNDFSKLKALLSRADPNNAEIQFIQGKCFHLGLAGYQINHAEAVNWYRKAADQGSALAQNNLGVCYRDGKGTARNAAEAVKWFRKAAEQGLSIAQNNLGCCCWDGNGTAWDSAEAFKWFRKAAEQGHLDAQNNLGVCYRDGNGTARNLAEAVKWIRKAAEQGHLDAQNNLGVCYRDGNGVGQNSAEAVKWIRKAAEEGHLDAQYNLGTLHEFGQGVKQDYAEALKWYRKAAEQNSAVGQFKLGFFYDMGKATEQNYYEAVKWYRKAAEQGDVHAQNNLGACYVDGQGVDKDLHEGAKWYRKAAEQGYALAQFNLGCCYDNGEGVDKDFYEAVKWYRKSAEQGHARAQFNLGCCYEKGQGVDKDLHEMVKWYRKSAEQGHARAQFNLGCCYEKGQGVDKDLHETVKWYRKSAEQGYVPAQNDLGVCYYAGKGVVKNYYEAVKWFRKAVEGGGWGSAWAQNNLAVCYLNGHGVKQDKDEAVKWFRKAAQQGHEGAQRTLDEAGLYW